MKPTKEMLQIGDFITFGGLRHEYLAIRNNLILLWASDSDQAESWNEHHLKEVTHWMRGDLNLIDLDKCPECLNGCLKADSIVKDCNKCQGLGFLKPVKLKSVKPKRFEIRTGKYGQYFYDAYDQMDMSLIEVLDILNWWHSDQEAKK